MISVLYVDDDPDLLFHAKNCMENSGEISVVTSTSARASLDSPQIQSYDAIVSDYQMPETDGIAFLKEVRQRYGDLPFILFTERAGQDAVIEALNSGADFYLEKGTDPKSRFTELTSKIQYAVSRRRAEKELAESEERFRGMAERSSDLIFILDRQMSPIYVSPSARTIIGYDPGELVGKSPEFATATLFSRSGTKFMEGVRDNLEGRIVDNFEMQIQKKDGDMVDINVHAVPVIQNGEFAGAQVSMRDITAGKKAQKALHESEEKFRSFVENANDIVFSLTPTGVMSYISPRWTELMGYEASETIGRPASDFVHPDDYPRNVEFFRQTFRTGKKTSGLEYRVRHKNGTWQWHSQNGSVMRDADGNVTSYLGIARDITEQKKAAEALKESEMKFRSIVETTPDIIWEIDLQGKIQYVSPMVEKRLGYLPEELVGKKIPEMIPEEDRPFIYQEMARVFSSEEPYMPLEVPARHRNGSGRILEIRPSKLTDSKGILIGMRGMAIDITERKRAEMALHESEEKFRSFVENANDIVFSLTPEGIFSYVSPRWTELLGHNTRDLIGKSSASFIHPDDLPRTAEVFRQAVRTGKKTSGLEYRILDKNGSWQWHSQSLSPVFDATGRVVAIQGICHDITKRKTAEEALRRANHQLNLLGSITRHDTANKITVILSYLSIAKTKFSDPALGEYLKKIESATQAIQSQIEFARVYQDIGTHPPQWINLESVLPWSQVPETVTLKSDVQGIGIYANPMLEMVFANLLDNSLRHGQRVTEIRVSASRADGGLVILWEDNGTGIAADEKEKIFERGFGKHTGLGMFLAREILALTGMTITETGEPGRGARFEITVPKDIWFKRENST